MQPVFVDLSPNDMLTIAAYVASLPPPPRSSTRVVQTASC